KEMVKGEFIGAYSLANIIFSSNHAIDTSFNTNKIFDDLSPIITERMENISKKESSSIFRRFPEQENVIDSLTAFNHDRPTGLGWENPDTKSRSYWSTTVDRPFVNSYYYLDVSCPVEESEILVENKLQESVTNIKLVMPIDKP